MRFIILILAGLKISVCHGDPTKGKLRIGDGTRLTKTYGHLLYFNIKNVFTTHS